MNIENPENNPLPTPETPNQLRQQFIDLYFSLPEVSFDPLAFLSASNREFEITHFQVPIVDRMQSLLQHTHLTTSGQEYILFIFQNLYVKGRRIRRDSADKSTWITHGDVLRNYNKQFELISSLHSEKGVHIFDPDPQRIRILESDILLLAEKEYLDVALPGGDHNTPDYQFLRSHLQKWKADIIKKYSK